MSIVFLITIADNIENKALHDIRRHEYMYCLSRFFSYNFLVYGVISESTSYAPASFFPFTNILYIPSTYDLGYHTKSQKEFISLKKVINNIDLPDNTWIIKASGRYMLTNDIFVEYVKNASEHTNAILKKVGDQMCTFLYAIRLSTFKKIIEYEIPPFENIERYFLNIIKTILTDNEIQYVECLGTFVNINNEEQFAYY